MLGRSSVPDVERCDRVTHYSRWPVHGLGRRPPEAHRHPLPPSTSYLLATRREVSVERSEVKKQVTFSGIVDDAIATEGIEGR